MKLIPTRSAKILLIVLGYVWCQIHLATGKCYGPWAIHACGGGNGKRSEIGDFRPEYSAESGVKAEEEVTEDVRSEVRSLLPSDNDFKSVNEERNEEEKEKEREEDLLRQRRPSETASRLREFIRQASQVNKEEGGKSSKGGDRRYINREEWMLLRRIFDGAR